MLKTDLEERRPATWLPPAATAVAAAAHRELQARGKAGLRLWNTRVHDDLTTQAMCQRCPLAISFGMVCVLTAGAHFGSGFGSGIFASGRGSGVGSGSGSGSSSGSGSGCGCGCGCGCGADVAE